MTRTLHAIPAPTADRVGGRSMLLLLHGYGADEHDLLPLAAAVAPDDAAVSLRGPLPLGAGAAWADGGSEDVLSGAGLEEAADDVLALLDALPAPPRTIRLLGFSQGGALALALLGLEPQRFEATVVLSGFVAAGQAAAPAGAPVFWGRGDADAVIPTAAVARTEAWLRAASATVRVYPGLGHAVSAGEVADVASFLRRASRSA